MNKLGVGLVALCLVGAFVSVLAQSAFAACHIAAFEQSSYNVNEGAGTVTLKVVLQGRQPACAGTIDYATENDSAEAGKDYDAKAGTLTFVTADDREETISVPIRDDSEFEGAETFRVKLSDPTGGITGVGGPATVSIKDNDASPAPDPPKPPKASPTTPTPEATGTLTPRTDSSPGEGPVVETPEDEGSGLAPQAAGDEDGGVPTSVIVALVAILLAGGAAVGLWYLRKASV